MNYNRSRPSPRTTKPKFRPQTIRAVPKITAYDRESGLVYREVEVSGVSSNLNWIFDYRSSPNESRRPRPTKGQGCRSLVEMALAKISREAQDLTPGALRTLPWDLGSKIWGRIIDDSAETFYLWRTFSVAYGSDFADPKHRYILDLKISRPLIEYYGGLASGKFEWLTCLRISPKQISIPDLVNLSSITNLSVLDLSDGQLYIENRESTFDARVMRTWSELARSGRAFQCLRVLLLGWQEKVDKWIFNYLSDFPKLTMVIMTDCHCIHHKNHKSWEEDVWKHGWQFMPSKRGVKHLRPLLDDKDFRTNNISNFYYESRRLSTGSFAKVATMDKPLLEAWLGSPRPWAHIIDEFPGTRTVFFQRQTTTQIDKIPNPAPSRPKCPSKRTPEEQQSSNDAYQSSSSTGPRRKAAKHSAASLLAGFL